MTHIVLHSSVTVAELAQALRGTGIKVEYQPTFDAVILRQAPLTLPVETLTEDL